MRLLLINPNTTAAMTQRMAASAEAVKNAGTRIVPLTAGYGVPYISSRAEAQIGGTIALEMLAEHHEEGDAAIIAAFGDPGLFAARELFDIPVVGLAEAVMFSACMIGRRFAIVTFATALVPWYEECVAMHGLSGRCAGVLAVDSPFRDAGDVQEEKEELLVESALRAVRERDADVIIMGGAPLSGLAAKVADRIPVPVVDQVAAAVKQAEALVALTSRKATEGTFRRPAPKPTTGLSPSLARRIEHAEAGLAPRKASRP